MLLYIGKGAQTYDEIKTVKGKIYPTFKAACLAHGLLEDDKEWHHGLRETTTFTSGNQVRELLSGVGSRIKLLRNLDPQIGLCKGTRLNLTHLGQTLIEAEIMEGDFGGSRVLPRKTMTPKNCQFLFERNQFPVKEFP